MKGQSYESFFENRMFKQHPAWCVHQNVNNQVKITKNLFTWFVKDIWVAFDNLAKNTQGWKSISYASHLI